MAQNLTFSTLAHTIWLVKLSWPHHNVVYKRKTLVDSRLWALPGPCLCRYHVLREHRLFFHPQNLDHTAEKDAQNYFKANGGKKDKMTKNKTMAKACNGKKEKKKFDDYTRFKSFSHHLQGHSYVYHVIQSFMQAILTTIYYEKRLLRRRKHSSPI